MNSAGYGPLKKIWHGLQLFDSFKSQGYSKRRELCTGKITLRINERGETDPMTIHVDESRIHRLILKILTLR